MYSIDDKISAIKAVQRFLFLNETGIFNSDTKKAVEEKQRSSGLEITGTVDLETYELILNDYKLKENTDRINYETPLKGGFPYKIGDYGNDITILNAMLSEVIAKEGLKLWRPRGNYFSRTTSAAVERLREIFQLEAGTQIDELFYHRLKNW